MINYKHLHYFWVVAKEGGVVKAAKRLHLTPQTISTQLTSLEEQFGETLFERSGRQMQLNEAGRMVLGHAEKIFSLGAELEELMRNRQPGKAVAFRVGIADVVPKSIAYRLLSPALGLRMPVKMICREGPVKSLLAELALHDIDLIIADSPMPPGISVRGFNHYLGECGLSFLASAPLVRETKGEFPLCLNDQPVILPGEASEIRSQLEQWLEERGIYPRVVGEFDDSALMNAFGSAGAGIIIAPTPIEAEVIERYRVERIGRTTEVKQQFYVISTERKISLPAVSAIMDAARDWLE